MDSDRNQPLITETGEKDYPSLSDESDRRPPQIPIALSNPNNNSQQLYGQAGRNNQQYPQQQGAYNQQQGGYYNQQNNQQTQQYGQGNYNQPRPMQQQQGGYPQPQNQQYPAYQQQGPGPYAPQQQNYNYNNGQQPAYAGQQPLPNLDQRKIVIVREHSAMPCQMCGYDGMSAWRQTAGCTTYSWCVCLFCFTGVFGFWIPFCIDSCYDTEIICSRCSNIKGNIPADCC